MTFNNSSFISEKCFHHISFIYTDGSKSEDRVSSAFGINHQKRGIAIPKHTSIFTAEANATHTLNLCSAFNPSKCTHTAVNTRSSGQPIYAAAPGEQLGVWCLPQGHLSRGIEGGKELCTFTPPTYNSCRT